MPLQTARTGSEGGTGDPDKGDRPLLYQKKKKRALQTRLILWLVRRSGRSISPESKDEIQKDGQDSKQHDEENRDEAHKRGVGNDHNHQYKQKDQRHQGQDKACADTKIRGVGLSYIRAPGPESLVRHLDLVRGQRRQLIAWSRAHLIGRFTTRLFFKLRVLLRHSETSRVVTLFFFPLI